MQIVSMAKSLRQKQDEAKPYDERDPADIEDYAYGLSIHLSHEELAKLGFARGELDAGMMVKIAGEALVTNVDARQVNGVKRFSASLQIQKLGAEINKEEDARADTLFGAHP